MNPDYALLAQLERLIKKASRKRKKKLKKERDLLLAKFKTPPSEKEYKELLQSRPIPSAKVGKKQQRKLSALNKRELYKDLYIKKAKTRANPGFTWHHNPKQLRLIEQEIVNRGYEYIGEDYLWQVWHDYVIERIRNRPRTRNRQVNNDLYYEQLLDSTDDFEHMLLDFLGQAHSSNAMYIVIVDFVDYLKEHRMVVRIGTTQEDLDRLAQIEAEREELLRNIF